MTKRVYTDTSVVGGHFDTAFSADTIPFFDAVTKGQFIEIKTPKEIINYDDTTS